MRRIGKRDGFFPVRPESFGRGRGRICSCNANNLHGQEFPQGYGCRSKTSMDETAPPSGLSLSQRIWTPPTPPIDSTSLAALRDGLGISAVFGEILAARNLLDVEEARGFAQFRWR